MICSRCKLVNKCRSIRKASKQHFRWTFHNLVGHPLSEIFWLLGFKRWSDKIHDKTIPEHEVGEGRG